MLVEGRRYKCTSVTGAYPTFEDYVTGDKIYTDDFVMISNGAEYKYRMDIIQPKAGSEVYCTKVSGDTAYIECEVVNVLLDDVVPDDARDAITQAIFHIRPGGISDNSIRRLYDIIVPYGVKVNTTRKDIGPDNIYKWIADFIVKRSKPYSGSTIGAASDRENFTFLCVELLGEVLGEAYVKLALNGECDKVSVSIANNIIVWDVDGTDVISFISRYLIGMDVDAPAKIARFDKSSKGSTQSSKFMDRIARTMSGD